MSVYVIARGSKKDVREYWNSYHGVWGTDRRMATRLSLVDARTCARDEDGDVRRLRVKKAPARAPAFACGGAPCGSLRETHCLLVALPGESTYEAATRVVTERDEAKRQTLIADEAYGRIRAKLDAVTSELKDEGRLRVEAEARLAEMAAERDALKAKLGVILEKYDAAHDALSTERREADTRVSNMSAKLAAVTLESEAMRICADGWEAQSNRNMNQCGELTRRAEAAEFRLAEIAALVGGGK